MINNFNFIMLFPYNSKYASEYVLLEDDLMDM